MSFPHIADRRDCPGQIFGVLVSTGLTLFVIPSMYVLFVERLGMKTASE